MGQNNFGGFNSTNPPNFAQQPQTNFGLNLPTPAINTQHQNDGQINNMTNFFQTTNYDNLNAKRAQPNDPKAIPDFLKNNKPDTFATMGGAGNNGGFNMTAFGTMQLNQQQKTTTLDFNFLDKKPNTTTSSGAGNLI